MPTYDRLCIDSNCNTEIIDCFEPMEAPVVLCPKCGKNTERAWIGKPCNVVGDDIPGGIWIRHGLCDETTGSPRKYYSKSEIAKEAERRGLVNRVEHTVDPRTGSDKNRHTVRWVSSPVISEEERLRVWLEFEKTMPIGARLGTENYLPQETATLDGIESQKANTKNSN